jgi:MFS family permease
MFSAFSLQNGSIQLWIGVWVIYSLASLLIRSVVWNPPVSTAFVANRGVAIAILLTGMSLASAASPLLAHTLIESLGWRGAYIGIGLGWTGVALALVIPFFRVRETQSFNLSDGTAPPKPKTVPGGLSGKEALRNTAIIRIGLAGLLLTTLGAALGVHLVPIFTWLGLARGEAASIALLYGAAAAISKIIVGTIADRVKSDLLPVAAMGIGGVGYLLLLLSNGSVPIMLIGSVVIGIGSGAMLHMIMYLTTQYGGLRNFGKIYGSVSALFGLAGGIGPIAAGMIFDATQSYELLLTLALPMFAMAALLVAGLGPYPEFEPVDIEPAQPGPALQASR